MKAPNCPRGHGPMVLQTIDRQMAFKGVDICVPAQVFICPTCGLEAGTVQTGVELQLAIADAYRASQELLTSSEIKALRKSRNLTQQQLAEMMNIGIASIKRWETGTVQSASMDQALRMQLQCRVQADNYSGNREISLARIKLVARSFENILKIRLLKKNDRFLFLAKYLWYADFLSFRELGRGLTGASYAAMQYGPQLNNYKELVSDIKDADIKTAESLSNEEMRIIRRVAERFPAEQSVFEAAHKEKVWEERKVGALIPYSCAAELAGI